MSFTRLYTHNCHIVIRIILGSFSFPNATRSYSTLSLYRRNFIVDQKLLVFDLEFENLLLLLLLLLRKYLIAENDNSRNDLKTLFESNMECV